MTALIAGAAVAFVLWSIRVELRQRRREATLHHLISTLGPAPAAALHDPKALLAWYPLVRTCRKLFPAAFAELDASAGGAFPFTKEQLQAAHARWTAEWLAWERAHEAEYAVKAAHIQDEIDKAAGHASPLVRTRLAAVEQEKLERYQQRYEEYIRTARALASFAE